MLTAIEFIVFEVGQKRTVKNTSSDESRSFIYDLNAAFTGLSGATHR
jgi:hypothetical protein